MLKHEASINIVYVSSPPPPKKKKRNDKKNQHEYDFGSVATHVAGSNLMVCYS